MIRELRFAAPFVYAVRGTSDVSIRSQQLRDRIKRADSELLPQIARHVAALLQSHAQLKEFFGPGVTLVPVPGRAPLAPGAVGRSQRICHAFLEENLAGDALDLVERVQPVAKSAYAAPGNRPSAQQHFESMVCSQQLAAPARIVLLDDIVTRGATLIGAASRLRTRFPNTPILSFALMRPVSHGDIAAIRDFVVGSIQCDEAGTCIRRP